MNDNYDEYGVDWIRIYNNEDKKLLKKIKKIINTNVTGEEYIQFNAFIDKLENEFEENEDQQKIFNETKSSGLDVEREGNFYAFKTFDSNYDNKIRNATDLYRDWRKGGQHERYLTHNEVEITIEDEDGAMRGSRTEWANIENDTYEKASERVKRYLFKKHRANNEEPLYNIGKSLDLFRDYWGNYKSFQGKLKPIDVASYMTQICTLIGEYLRNTCDKGKGGRDGNGNNRKTYQAPEIDQGTIDYFIRIWNQDKDRTFKFPDKPESDE